MDKIDDILYSSTVDVLSSVGESTMQAFVLQLMNEGIDFSAEAVDIKGVESKLKQFFGVGSPVMIERIYEGFMKMAFEKGYLGTDVILMLHNLPVSLKRESFERLVNNCRKNS